MQAIHNNGCWYKEEGGSCFKEQRYKINASNSQPASEDGMIIIGCFKEQRYKINASNSQHLKSTPLK